MNTKSSLSNKHAVTGAFGYSGRYIAQKLLSHGHDVITLTSRPQTPGLFATQIPAYPFNFENPIALAASLDGVHTLYNTYWVRFSHGSTTYAKAVANTKILFQAAKSAGVQRIVHVSITNPHLDSPLPYFSGKADLENALKNTGLSYAILRPTVIFGQEDILINNIAYLLRRFPFFVIPGSGEYQLQPIYVEDLAEIAVAAGQTTGNIVIDAIGPETFSFNQLVETLAHALNRRTKPMHLYPQIALLLSRVVGLFVHDVVLTSDEVKGLMGNYLVTTSPPAGKTPLTSWIQSHQSTLGKYYASELARHYSLTSAA